VSIVDHILACRPGLGSTSRPLDTDFIAVYGISCASPLQRGTPWFSPQCLIRTQYDETTISSLRLFQKAYPSMALGLGFDLEALEDSCKKTRQRKIHTAILKASPFPTLFQTFRTRLSRFIASEVTDQDIGRLFGVYRRMGSKLRGCFISSHLSAVLNQFCTTRRFGQVGGLCPYCLVGPD
jgi:hypothetical protein